MKFSVHYEIVDKKPDDDIEHLAHTRPLYITFGNFTFCAEEATVKVCSTFLRDIINGDQLTDTISVVLPHPEKKYWYPFVKYFRTGDVSVFPKNMFCPKIFINADFLGSEDLLKLMKKNFNRDYGQHALNIVKEEEFMEVIGECHFRFLLKDVPIRNGTELTNFGKALQYWVNQEDHSWTTKLLLENFC